MVEGAGDGVVVVLVVDDVEVDVDEVDMVIAGGGLIGCSTTISDDSNATRASGLGKAGAGGGGELDELAADAILGFVMDGFALGANVGLP